MRYGWIMTSKTKQLEYSKNSRISYSVFWNAEGVIHVGLRLWGPAINANAYCDIPWRLGEATRRKSLEYVTFSTAMQYLRAHVRNKNCLSRLIGNFWTIQATAVVLVCNTATSLGLWRHVWNAAHSTEVRKWKRLFVNCSKNKNLILQRRNF